MIFEKLGSIAENECQNQYQCYVIRKGHIFVIENHFGCWAVLSEKLVWTYWNKGVTHEEFSLTSSS